MQIRYVMGDLMTATEPVIVHGCNARGIMGSGVAKAIRDRYPHAYEKYRDRYLNHGLHLGECIWVECGDHVIVNAITQESFGSDPNVQYVFYDAISQVMREINSHRIFAEDNRVAMPLIGAGRGGGSWPHIASIIESELTLVQPVVYHRAEDKIPTK